MVESRQKECALLMSPYVRSCGLPTRGFAHPRKHSSGGHAVVEVALMAPWIFFLFVGVLDVGFYCYALIAVQNAARVAAIQVSGSQTTAVDVAFANTYACAAVLQELVMMPNMGTTPACAIDGNTIDAAHPVAVATQFCPGGLKAPGAAVMPACVGTDPYWEAEVKYQTVPLVPIPGMLTGQLDIFRSTQVKQGN